MSFRESDFVHWWASTNYAMMEWTQNWYWFTWAALFFFGCMIKMSPLSTHHEQSFFAIVRVRIRQSILFAGFLLISLPIIELYLYDVTFMYELGDHAQDFLDWFIARSKEQWFLIPLAIFLGYSVRFSYERYVAPAISGLLRRARNNQSNEVASDIRTEREKFNPKDFDPQPFYKKGNMFIGLDEKGKPTYLPDATWYETHMMIVGPTRYGKGITAGVTVDQAIRRGDCVFMIDPKKDKWVHKVMLQACVESGRKFIYLTLHDDGIGSWGPFTGGDPRDAFARACAAFGLEDTGDPGTDFYKGQERDVLENVMDQTRSVKEMLSVAQQDERAQKLVASLRAWARVESLCAKKGKGFSIEKALLENAVVYIQGSLTDTVVKPATKSFLFEVTQEVRRLDSKRKAHVSLYVDEIAFLISKQIADSLAVLSGFRCNMITQFQSVSDLKTPDDRTLDGNAILQRVSVNSQTKMLFGGADSETAQWIAETTGTIQKQVAKMERTEVHAMGGEVWENGRTIGTLEETLIPMNVILTLPKRVGVLLQPGYLASVCFTNNVTVKDPEQLERFINDKEAKYKKVSDEPPEQSAAQLDDSHHVMQEFLPEQSLETDDVNEHQNEEKERQKRRDRKQAQKERRKNTTDG